MAEEDSIAGLTASVARSPNLRHELSQFVIVDDDSLGLLFDQLHNLQHVMVVRRNRQFGQSMSDRFATAMPSEN